MEAVRLSIVALLFKWATYCVDWFMDFFAEPENYWVAETYPSDAPSIAVARTINARVKIMPKYSAWLKECLNNSFIIARNNSKQLVLNFFEVCAATCYRIFVTLSMALHKDAVPIMV